MSENKKARKTTRDSDGSIIKRVEKRRTSNGKTRNETVYYARVRLNEYDASGAFVKCHERKRRAASFEDAKDLRRTLREEIKLEIEGKKEEEIEKPKAFSEILDYFENEYVREAVFVDDQKISGYKTDLETIRHWLNIMRAAFGDKIAGRITYDDVRRFKNERLATPVAVEVKKKIQTEVRNRNGTYKVKVEKEIRTRQRSFATVHRELSLLRRVFNIARRNGWIEKSPFDAGEPLINKTLEVQRLRICSLDEEKRLLENCTGHREHLKPILICALDTAMRKGEIFKLTWKMVDFERRSIHLSGRITKTEKPRTIPISARLLLEFRRLREVADSDEDLVFGIATAADRAFGSVCLNALVEGLRFHDLRGTAITRLLRAGLSAPEVMKISGHTEYSTFMIYVRQDEQGTANAAEALDSWLKSQT